MELIESLISYFGLQLIEECETFPELLQCLMCYLLAVYLVVMTIKALFGFMYNTNKLGRN